MKPSRNRFGKPVVITNSRWLGYATASAASTLACASSAEAEIHYSGHVNHDFAPPGSQATFPLDPGVNLYINVSTGIHVGRRSSWFGHIHIRTQSQQLAESAGDFVGTWIWYGGFYLLELPAGVSLPAQRMGNYCEYSSFCHCVWCDGGAIGGSGRFRDRSIGYIGFSFNRGAGLQYGWMRVNKSGPPDYRFHLLDYAWGDPGDSLSTGQRRIRQAEAAPEEGSLGWLALGAAGLLAWRKTRSQAAR